MKMKRKIISYLCVLALLLTTPATAFAGQADKEIKPFNKKIATLVLLNGSIYTMDKGKQIASAIAVTDDKIVYVGKDDIAKKYIGDNTKVIDLNGKMVTPGFVDGHGHAASLQLAKLTTLYLADVTPTLAAYREAIDNYIAQNPGTNVVIGKRFQINVFPSGEPENSFINDITIPVLLSDTSGHGLLVNTAALVAAGITKDTPAPDGGTIYKDAAGNLTGYFSDCRDMFADLQESAQPTPDQFLQAWKEYETDCATKGITALDDGGSGSLERWKQMDDYAKTGEMSMRINFPYRYGGFSVADAEKAVNDLKEGQKYVSDFQQINQVKTIIDGVPEGKTALLLKPYAPTANMPADYCGPQYCTPDELNKYVSTIDKAGYQVLIHAMGDGGANLSLNAYEYAQKENGKRDSRHTIVHANLLAPSDVPRMGKLGVYGAMQPIWFYYDPLFSALEEQMFGTERFEQEYVIRDMLNAGVVMTGSSDYSVTPDNRPLVGIEVGATQCSPYPGEQDNPVYLRDPDQTVSVMDMLKFYTINGAKQMFMEDKIGTLEVGKKADMVVIEKDITKINVKDISETKVVSTIFNGKIIYPEPASLVLKNGAVYTMDENGTTASAVAVANDQIAFVGDDNDVEYYIGDSTDVIDLNGKMVTPGFVDGHIHPTLAPPPDTLDLTDVEPTVQAYQAALQEYAGNHPDMTVINGEGLQIKAFPDGKPDKSMIDEVISPSSGIYVIISDTSFHGMLVNTVVLEASGITKDTVAPPGGQIYKDAEGNPTGYFSDADSLLKNIPDNYVEPSEEQRIDAFGGFVKDMNTEGITALDGGGGGSPDIWEMVDDYSKTGDMTMRVNLPYRASGFTVADAEEAVEMLDENQKYNSDYQRINQVKNIIDGVPEGKTVLLKEPYAPGAEMPDDYCGPQYCTQDELSEFVATIDKAGYQTLIHAMGDGGAYVFINAVEYAQEQNGERDARHTMVHANFVDREDITRMADLGVYGALQPIWCYYDPIFSALEKKHLGDARFMKEYAVRDMLKDGVILSGSADWSISDNRPLFGIETGMTQCSPYPGQQDDPTYLRNPDQTVSVMDMLKMYTINGAKQMFMDDIIGSLEVGKKADMVVLAQDITKVAAEDISETEIVDTIFNGKIVYGN